MTGLSLVYRAVLLAVSIFIIFRYNKTDRAAKIICFLIWLGMLTESVGYYTAKVYRNNYPVFTVSVFMEFILICLYFNYSVEAMRRRKTGIYIAATGVCLGIMNTLFLQPFKTSINSNFLFLECLVTICLVMYSIYKMVKLDDDNLQLQRTAHFWFPCILLFYQCATLWSWIIYEHLSEIEDVNATVIDIAVLSVNLITYLSYGVLFFFYPKMNKAHV